MSEISNWSEPVIVTTQSQLTYSDWSESTIVKTNPSGITDLFDIEEAEFIFHENDDYLEIKFDEPQWMNFITFELNDVPLEWSIKYFNDSLNKMVTVTDWYGDDLEGWLIGSFRAYEARDSRTIRQIDDWIQFSYDIVPIKTSKIEFHFRRTGGRQSVVELDYRYSYAIRNVDLRYNIREYDQVLPIRDDQVAIRNLLGYTERLAVREWESQRAIDGNENTFWKSSPQPTAKALVPFYIDVRNNQGEGQLIDAVEIDPVYSGPSMNVYYSNDDTVGSSFRLSRYKRDLQVEGYNPDFTPEGLEVTENNSAARLTDNDYMRFDTERSFVFGVTYTIDSNSGGTILDTGTIQLQYLDGVFSLVSYNGDVLVSHNIVLYEGDRVAINAGFIHNDDAFILWESEYFNYDALAIYDDSFDTYDGRPIDENLLGGWYLHLTRLIFHPRFTRDSIAYYLGEEYNVNQHRIQNNTLFLEQGTTNILSEDISKCETWYSNGGSDVEISFSTVDPYGGREGVRIEAVGGDTAYKARMPLADIEESARGQIAIRAYDKPVKITPRDSGEEFIVRPDEGWQFLRWISDPGDGNDQIQVRSLDPNTEEELIEDITFGAAFAQYEYSAIHTSWQLGGTTRSSESLVIPRDVFNFGSVVYLDIIYPEVDCVLLDSISGIGLTLGSSIALTLHNYEVAIEGGQTGDRVNIAIYVDESRLGIAANNLTQGVEDSNVVEHDLISTTIEGNVILGSDIDGENHINTSIYSLLVYGPGYSYSYVPVVSEYLYLYENEDIYHSSSEPDNPLEDNLWFNEEDGYLYRFDGSNWNKEFREIVTPLGDSTREIYSYSFEGDEESVFVSDILAQTTAKYEPGNVVDGNVYDFTIGSNRELDDPAGGKIQFVYVRQDRFSHILARHYARNPERFTFIEGPVDRLRGDQNTLFVARFLMGFDQMAARVGPDHNYYADKIWTPIYRDFKLRRGQLTFDPIFAKYIKLEFTDLVGRPYKIDGSRAVRRWYYDYPDWVHAYFEDIENRNFGSEQQGQGVPFQGNPIYDRTKHGMPMFDPVSGELVIFSTEPKKFYRTSYHDYKLKEMEQDYNQAFFVGLRNVSVFRRDYQVSDHPSIVDTFGDLQMVQEYTLNYRSDRQQFIATQPGQYFDSVIFNSYSNYQTIQIAVQGSQWESQLSDRQLSLVTTDHIDVINGISQNIADRVTGEGAGKVLEVYPSSIGEFGFVTKRGLTGVGDMFAAYDYADDPYDSGSNTYDDHFSILTHNIRTSAVARIHISRSDKNAVFELRLYQQGNLVSRDRFTNLGIGFHELETLYISKSGDLDFQAEIVEVIDTEDELNAHFALDFLGIFQNPVSWEVSNDGGITWRNVIASINNYDAYVTFVEPSNQFKIRAVGQRPGAIISSYTIIPWYLESPVVSRAPIDYLAPDGVSETDSLRSTKHKPSFQLWHHYFPRKYSLHQHGRVPVEGSGFQP